MPEERSQKAKKAGLITVILAGILVVLKTGAFLISGSVAVLASLLDSVMDIAVSTLNYAAIRYSSKPADAEHRYGHGKIEGVAAMAQATLMVCIGLFIAFEAFNSALEGQVIQDPLLSASLILVSTIFSVAIIWVQTRAVEQTKSLAIESDKAHYTADLLQHCSVILILIWQYFGGSSWMDILLAFAISIWMLISAKSVAQKAFDMILDRELSEHERDKVIAIIEAHPEVLGFHDLRAIKHGMKELIFFDIEADPDVSLTHAHQITKDLERDILKMFPHAEIMIHVDPYGDIEDSRHKVASIHH